MGIKILVCILSLPGLILGHTHPLGKRVVCFSTVLANWYPDEAQIFDFPIIAQMPELPTGCEITALTMLLHAKGYDVDKYEMAMTYLPRVPYRLYTGDDGRLYGPDLNAYFVGNPSSEAGYVCGVTAIIRAGEQYLAAQNSALTVVDLTGASPEIGSAMVTVSGPYPMSTAPWSLEAQSTYSPLSVYHPCVLPRSVIPMVHHTTTGTSSLTSR